MRTILIDGRDLIDNYKKTLFSPKDDGEILLQVWWGIFGFTGDIVQSQGGKLVGPKELIDDLESKKFDYLLDQYD